MTKAAGSMREAIMVEPTKPSPPCPPPPTSAWRKRLSWHWLILVGSEVEELNQYHV